MHAPSLKKCVIINIAVTAGIVTLVHHKAKYNDNERSGQSVRGDNFPTHEHESLYHAYQVKTERLNRVRHVCGKYKLTELLDKNNPNPQYWNLIYNDQYKFIYSLVPKVASHTWRMIIGNYFSRSKVLSSCKTLEESAYRLQRYLVFIFVREPLERLLSAYLGKFTPRTKVQRLYEKVYGKRIVNKYREEKNSYDKIYGKKSRDWGIDQGQDWLNITFPEFVQMVLDDGSGIRINGMNHHWMPQHRVGLLCDVRYSFIGHYETLGQDTQYVFSTLGLDNLVKFPAVHKSTAAAHFDEYYGKLEPDFISKVIEFYRLDYEMFGYSAPPSIQRLKMIHPS